MALNPTQAELEWAHVEADVTVLKAYSATVHGVNLIKQRLPQRTLKEKAALVRETETLSTIWCISAWP